MSEEPKGIEGDGPPPEEAAGSSDAAQDKSIRRTDQGSIAAKLREDLHQAGLEFSNRLSNPRPNDEDAADKILGPEHFKNLGKPADLVTGAVEVPSGKRDIWDDDETPPDNMKKDENQLRLEALAAPKIAEAKRKAAEFLASPGRKRFGRTLYGGREYDDEEYWKYNSTQSSTEHGPVHDNDYVTYLVSHELERELGVDLDDDPIEVKDFDPRHGLDPEDVHRYFPEFIDLMQALPAGVNEVRGPIRRASFTAFDQQTSTDGVVLRTVRSTLPSATGEIPVVYQLVRTKPDSPAAASESVSSPASPAETGDR